MADGDARTSARRRFAEFSGGDPRGVLANLPLHLRTTGVTSDIASGVNKTLAAMAAKRAAIAARQQELDDALTKHQYELETERTKIEGKGEQDRMTGTDKGDVVERGGEIWERKPGEKDYQFVRRATFRPATVFNANDRVSWVDRVETKNKAMKFAVENVEARLGTQRETKAQPKLDARGNPVLVNGVPQYESITVETQKKVSSLAPQAKQYFSVGQGLVGQVAAGEIDPATALAQFEAARPKTSTAAGLAGDKFVPGSLRSKLAVAEGDIRVVHDAIAAQLGAAAQESSSMSGGSVEFDPSTMTDEQLRAIVGE